jgi:hypothetical protein
MCADMKLTVGQDVAYGVFFFFVFIFIQVVCV